MSFLPVFERIIENFQVKENRLRSGDIFSGTRWTAVGQVFVQGIRFGVFVVLARLLAPEDFGLLGMATVLTGFVGLFQSLGTTGAIIQARKLSSGLLSSLCIINVLMGLILTGGLALGGSLMALLYDTPQVAPIIQVLGLTFFISSFGLVPSALLNRDMHFDRLVQIETVTAVVQGIVAISLAYLGWKVWSLVAATITSSTVSTCLLFWASSWRFQWHFHWSEVRNVMKFSLNLTGTHIVSYLFQNTDKFIIGRFIGATSLGYYSAAYNLYMLPVQSVSRVLNRVLFPAFSRVQDDNVKLKQAFLRVAGGVALIMFPIVVGLGVVAHPFVLSILGEKWSPIIPLIVILSPVGMFNSIAMATGNIYLAKGRSDWLFWWNLGAGTAIVASYFCGLPWGIIGIVSAYAIVMIPLTYFGCVIPFRLINLPLPDLLVTIRPYAVASAVMAGLVLICRLVLEDIGLDPLWVLATCVMIGVVAYTSIILFQRPAALSDLVRVLPEGLQGIGLWRLLPNENT